MDVKLNISKQKSKIAILMVLVLLLGMLSNISQEISGLIAFADEDQMVTEVIYTNNFNSQAEVDKVVNTKSSPTVVKSFDTAYNEYNDGYLKLVQTGGSYSADVMYLKDETNIKNDDAKYTITIGSTVDMTTELAYPQIYTNAVLFNYVDEKNFYAARLDWNKEKKYIQIQLYQWVDGTAKKLIVEDCSSNITSANEFYSLDMTIDIERNGNESLLVNFDCNGSSLEYTIENPLSFSSKLGFRPGANKCTATTYINRIAISKTYELTETGNFEYLEYKNYPYTINNKLASYLTATESSALDAADIGGYKVQYKPSNIGSTLSTKVEIDEAGIYKFILNGRTYNTYGYGDVATYIGSADDKTTATKLNDVNFSDSSILANAAFHDHDVTVDMKDGGVALEAGTYYFIVESIRKTSGTTNNIVLDYVNVQKQWGVQDLLEPFKADLAKFYNDIDKTLYSEANQSILACIYDKAVEDMALCTSSVDGGAIATQTKENLNKVKTIEEEALPQVDELIFTESFDDATSLDKFIEIATSTGCTSTWNKDGKLQVAIPNGGSGAWPSYLYATLVEGMADDGMVYTIDTTASLTAHEHNNALNSYSVGMVFNAVDSKNFYTLRVDAEQETNGSTKFELYKFSNGANKELYSKSITDFVVGDDYEINLQAELFRSSKGLEVICSYTDNTGASYEFTVLDESPIDFSNKIGIRQNCAQLDFTATYDDISVVKAEKMYYYDAIEMNPLYTEIYGDQKIYLEFVSENFASDLEARVESIVFKNLDTNEEVGMSYKLISDDYLVAKNNHKKPDSWTEQVRIMEITPDADLTAGNYQLVFNGYVGAVETPFEGLLIAGGKSELSFNITVNTPVDYAGTKEVISLNGDWMFNGYDAIYPVDGSEDWTNADYDYSKDNGWMDVQVPNNWNVYNEYANMNPWNPTGAYGYSGWGYYQREFEVSEEYKGAPIYIDLTSVLDFSEVYINGVKVGWHDGGYIDFAFRIDGYLNYGAGATNTIVVKALNYRDTGAWLKFGGISGDVSLVVYSDVRIDYQHITQNLDLKDESASLDIMYGISNTNSKDVSVEVLTKIYNNNGTEIASGSIADMVIPAFTDLNEQSGDIKDIYVDYSGETELDEINGEKIGGEVLHIDLDFADIELWELDNPVLYQAVTEIKVDGVVVSEVSENIGFRTVEFTDITSGHGKMLDLTINGEYMVLHGSNRIWYDRVEGNTEPNYLTRRDIDYMKTLGMNFARISHIPMDSDLVEYCNEVGFLLIAEAGLWGANEPYVTTKPVGTQPSFWLKNGVINYFNSPSIFAWSVGNEYDYNSNSTPYTKAMAEYMKQIDPARMVTWASLSNNDFGKSSPFVDFVSRNVYGSSPEGSVENQVNKFNKPVFLTEMGTLTKDVEDVDKHDDSLSFYSNIKDIRGFMGSSLWTMNDYRSIYANSGATQNRVFGYYDVWGNEKIFQDSMHEELTPVKDSTLSIDASSKTGTISITNNTEQDLTVYNLKNYFCTYDIYDLNGEIAESGMSAMKSDLDNGETSSAVFNFETAVDSIERIRVSVISPLGYQVYFKDYFYNVSETAIEITEIVASANNVRVVFDRNVNVDEYLVYYGIDDVTENVGGHVYKKDYLDISGLDENTTYKFAVVPSTESGVAVPVAGNIVTATTKGTFTAETVEIPAIVPIKDGFVLGMITDYGYEGKYAEAENYSYYIRYAKSVSGLETATPVWTNLEGSYRVEGLDGGNEYFVQIKLLTNNDSTNPQEDNVTEYSEWSHVLSVTPYGDSFAPEKPEVLSTYSSIDSAIIHLDEIKYMDEYIVKYKAESASDFTEVVIPRGAAQFIVLNGLEDGTTYDITVASSRNGDSSEPSQPIEITTQKLGYSGAGLTFTQGSAEVKPFAIGQVAINEILKNNGESFLLADNAELAELISDVTYSSSNSDIVAVFKDGSFVARKYGDASISATFKIDGNEVSGSIGVSVVHDESIQYYFYENSKFMATKSTAFDGTLKANGDALMTKPSVFGDDSYLEFTFDVAEAGEYLVNLNARTCNDPAYIGGVWDFTLNDGEKVTIDFGKESQAYRTKELFASLELEKGENVLKLYPTTATEGSTCPGFFKYVELYKFNDEKDIQDTASAISASLTAEYNTIKENGLNYSTSSMTAFETSYANYIETLKTADDISDITTALLDSSMLVIAGDDTALETSKATAITELETYVDSADYREVEQATLATEIANGKTAIEECETVEDVATALETAKTAIDAIKTDAELTAEEDAETAAALATAKEAKVTAINAELAKYTEADYRTAEWTALQAIFTEAETEVNAMTDIATVEAYDVATVVADADAIKTDAELTAEEDAETAAALATAKETKVTAINAELAKYTEAGYRAAEWTALQAIFTEAVTAVNAMEDKATVEAYDVATVVADADAIKTDAELTAEEEAAKEEAAKEAAETEIDSLITDDTDDAVKDIIESVKDELENATTVEEIQEVKDKAEIIVNATVATVVKGDETDTTSVEIGVDKTIKVESKDVDKIIITDEITATQKATMSDKTTMPNGFSATSTVLTVKVVKADTVTGDGEPVVITIPYSGKSSSEYKVAHEKADGTVEYLDATYSSSAKTLTFTITSFSPFMVLEKVGTTSGGSSGSVYVPSTGSGETVKPTVTPQPTVAPVETAKPQPTVVPVETAKPAATTAPVVTQAPTTTQDQGSNAWIWIALAVVVIAGGVVIFVKKRKSK